MHERVVQRRSKLRSLKNSRVYVFTTCTRNHIDNTCALTYVIVFRAVARRDNGGEGVFSYIHVHIYRKNNRFQKKSVGQNTNI